MLQECDAVCDDNPGFACKQTVGTDDLIYSEYERLEMLVSVITSYAPKT